MELHTYCAFHYIGVAHDEGLQVEYLPLTVYSLIELSHQNNFHNIVQHPYVYVPLFRVARTCVAICLISRPSLVLVMVWGHYYTEMIASRLIWITNQKSKIWHAPLWAWLFSEIKATITQLCFVALAVPTWQSFSRWPNSILDLPSKYTTACVVNKKQKFLRCLKNTVYSVLLLRCIVHQNGTRISEKVAGLSLPCIYNKLGKLVC